MTIENNSISTQPSQHRDTRAELIDDDDVESFAFTTYTPILGSVGRNRRRDCEEGRDETKERRVGEIVKEDGEKEGQGEVQLTKDCAEDGEASKDGRRKDGGAEDVDVEGSCMIMVSAFRFNFTSRNSPRNPTQLANLEKCRISRNCSRSSEIANHR